MVISAGLRVPGAGAASHVALGGQTLSEIAAEKVGRPVFSEEGSLRLLLELNPEISDPDRIRPRQLIRLPDFARRGIAGSRVSPEESVFGPFDWSQVVAFDDGTKEPRDAGVAISHQAIYVSHLQKLEGVPSEFRLRGWSLASFSLRGEYKVTERLEAGLGLEYFHLRSLDADTGQHRMMPASVSAWIPGASLGYRIPLSRRFALVPTVSSSLDAVQYLRFGENTELVLDQGRSLRVAAGLGTRIGPSTQLNVSYYRHVAALDAGAEALGLSQGAASELRFSYPAPSRGWIGHFGIVGQYESSVLSQPRDRWTRREVSLGTQIGLGLGF